MVLRDIFRKFRSSFRGREDLWKVECEGESEGVGVCLKHRGWKRRQGVLTLEESTGSESEGIE